MDTIKLKLRYMENENTLPPTEIILPAGEFEDLLKRIEILSNEKYEANQALRLQKDLATKAQAESDRRLKLLRQSKKTSEAALRSLRAIGHASYVPTMNRLEGLIEELAEEVKKGGDV